MWAVCNEGIIQFYLPPTHEPYPPLLPSRKASPPFGWYSLRLPTKGWPGWVDLGGWSHTEINFPYRELNPDTVTHHSTNRARCCLASLIETNAQTTAPGHHQARSRSTRSRVRCSTDCTTTPLIYRCRIWGSDKRKMADIIQFYKQWSSVKAR